MLKKAKAVIKDFRDLPMLMEQVREKFLSEPQPMKNLPRHLKPIH